MVDSCQANVFDSVDCANVIGYGKTPACVCALLPAKAWLFAKICSKRLVGSAPVMISEDEACEGRVPTPADFIPAAGK